MRTVILDHDLGTNPDDFFSLLMLLNSEDVLVPLVISGNNYPRERALLAKKIINQHGAEGIKVCAGDASGTIDFYAKSLIEDMEEGISTEYGKEIKRVLDTNENVTYLCIQGTSNVATFLREYPTYADRFEIVHMGMSMPTTEEYVGGGTNMEANPLAAKYLYELGLEKLKVVGSHTTINDAIRVHPDTELYKKLSESDERNHRTLFEHLLDYHKRRGIWPALHDPLATSVVLGCEYVDFERVSVDFNEKGMYKVGSKTKVLLSKSDIHAPESFMRLCTELV